MLDGLSVIISPVRVNSSSTVTSNAAESWRPSLNVRVSRRVAAGISAVLSLISAMASSSVSRYSSCVTASPDSSTTRLYASLLSRR